MLLSFSWQNKFSVRILLKPSAPVKIQWKPTSVIIQSKPTSVKVQSKPTSVKILSKPTSVKVLLKLICCQSLLTYWRTCQSPVPMSKSCLINWNPPPHELHPLSDIGNLQNKSASFGGPTFTKTRERLTDFLFSKKPSTMRFFWMFVKWICFVIYLCSFFRACCSFFRACCSNTTFYRCIIWRSCTFLI